MEQTRIARVRIIKNDKQGKPINIVILDLANGKTPIVRNQKQFLTDLEESGLLVGNVLSLQHPQIAKLKQHLIGGIVSGDFSYRKAGDKWTVTAESRIITDKNHPQFGEAKVGDVRVSESDRTLVEGFLFLSRADKYEQMYITADAEAMAKIALSGAFDNLAVALDDATEDVDPDELPADLLASATTEKVSKEKTKK